ncbi:MAG: hypothetical protein GY930_16350 [bacterium]|nr:hypothetical protein [bacterium]
MHLFQRSCFVASILSLTAVAGAQDRSGVTLYPVYSIDWHSVSVGSHTGITSGTLLVPGGGWPILGPVPTPWGGPPLYGPGPSCTGAPGGTPCPVDVDAVSLGFSGMLGSSSGIFAGTLRFSVDPFATGVSGIPGHATLSSEAAAMDSAADILIHPGALPPGPLGPGPASPFRGGIDGDGLRSTSGFTYPGLGLIEPCPPVTGIPAYAGDNLDALAFQETFQPSGTYFSLEGSITDPLTGVPAANSAAFNGFVGGDILKVTATGPVIYAPASALGLDLVQGPGSDDVDALAVHDYTGSTLDGIYVPPTAMYDWELGVSDLILFSVRRGSAVIGQMDSLLGLPIQEGDILMPPLPGGGLSPYPAIFYAGERLGLASVRSGTAVGNFSDDLDALGYAYGAVIDCNHDGWDDIVQIGSGTHPDGDGNGVPDDCQLWSYCGVANPNSTGLPTRLSGTLNMGPDAGLHLEADQGPPNQIGYFLVGPSMATPGFSIGQGRLCLISNAMHPIGRYNVAGTSMNSVGLFDASGVLVNMVGTSSVGTGFDIPTDLPSIGVTIQTGSYWHFQLWHRDVGGQSNFSDAVRMAF